MNELFREVKALKSDDVGIQIDIFGNCYVHRALPVYDESGHLPGCIKRCNTPGNTGRKPKMLDENYFIYMHA